MTIAPESNEGAATRLHERTTALVRDALRRYLADGGNAAALQSAVVALAAEARTRGILAEQLVIMVKEVLASLPEVRAMQDVADRVRLQQHVVTLCIREYFAS